jgi:antitoxin component YwqK of YwqJK toxin-antitoxin module
VVFYKEVSKDEQHKDENSYSNYDSIDNDDDEQHWSYNFDSEHDNYKFNCSYYGKCTEWYANGQKESERTYDDDGNFKLIVWYEDGQVKLEEFYKNGEKDGKCAYWYENGEQKSEYNYINGSETGNFIEWHINGNKYREWHSLDFLDGHSKDNGTLTQWYENGQIKSIEHQKDRGNYELIERYENGQIKTQGSYKKYRKNGKHIEWHKNGQRKFIKFYNYGELNDVCTYWDKDGQKEREEYYDNGLKEEGSYKGGKVVLLTKWYDNGQKKSEGSYKVDLDSHQFLGGNSSVRDGKWTEWYEDGKEKPEEDCLDNDFLEECDENDKPTVHRFSEFDDDIPF